MEDAFGRFVELLADCLDDPAVSGDELAARLHLSRAQFDRVVSAAAGEAPDRLRRRVLLERAAFRLRTTETGVLDVAVEAGYSSHEAFTRALGRAFGTAQLDRVGPAFVATVRRIDAEDRFDETFVDVTGGEPYVFTAAGMIAHILTYAAYRRTLVVGALAALGADVEDDPLAWFNPSL